MRDRRLWALAAILVALAAIGLSIWRTIDTFPHTLSVLLCMALAVVCAWQAVRRRGPARIVWGSAAALLLAGAIALVILEGTLVVDLIVAVLVVVALPCARNAFRVHAVWPSAPPPRHPFLFYNPRSGGGKAARFHLAGEARRRGIEPVELRGGQDLGELVRDALRDGADGLAMAGGDGSQAIVAMIASQAGVPYACIPAGTRNHFALDLGVDRNDVVGALDAFVDGGERRVDLAEVNGRVFVNNVSLGLYAEAVQRAGYRDAKIRTLLDTVPDVLGPGALPPQLRWSGPNGSQSGTAILVSNDSYLLGVALNSGTRPRLDSGKLGIVVFGPTGAETNAIETLRWSEQTFEIDADGPVPAGIDGEATVLDPPLRFRSLGTVLSVRISPKHPGASPSALQPDSLPQMARELVRLAGGREPARELTSGHS